MTRSTSTLATHLLLLVGIFVSAFFFAFPHAASAAEGDIDPSFFSKETGWTCEGNGFSNCVNESTNQTGSCKTYGTTVTTVVCTVTNADNTEVTTVANAIAGRTTATYDAGGTQTSQTHTDAPKSGCSILNMADCVFNVFKYGMSALAGALAAVVLFIASFFLYLAGTLFNLAVIKTVFEFGNYFGASDGMLIAWRIIRDIGNIVLLFGFIFMGIATILNTHAVDEFSARKALPRLIIFAILLNFSLFASQLVIDVSNSFAAVFTAQAGYDCTNNKGDPTSKTGCYNVGIAGNIIQMAGVSSIYSVSNAKEFFQVPERHAPVYIGLAIFVTITAVVLLAAAIMLIIRAVVLCLLMVTSPIGFAGMAIPPLQEFASKWWKSLLSNAFFAPIYLLIVLISLKIVDGLAGNQGSSFADALIHGDSNAPQIIVIFAVVIGFMIAALTVAKSMGAAGASYATSTAGKLVGGATFGTVGFIGRRTLGAASTGMANRIRSSKWDNVDPGLRRLAFGIANKGSTASYSVRGMATKAVKGTHSGLDFGKANKTAAHGFHGIEEKAIKDRTEFAKKLIVTPEEKAKDKALKAQKKSAEESQKKRDKNYRDRIAEKQKVIDDIASGVTASLINKQLAEQQQLGKDAAARGDTEAMKKSAAAIDDLNNKLKNLEKTSKEEAADIVKIQRARQDAAAADKAVIDDLDRQIKENSPQERYAAQVEAPKWYGKPVINLVSVGAHADHEAADKIRSNNNKSAVEKALDTIKENTDKKDDDHGEDHAEESHDADHGHDKKH